MREDQGVRAEDAYVGDFYGLDERERITRVTIDESGVAIETDDNRRITCAHETLLPIVRGALPSDGKTYREVTEQNGSRHASSVDLTPEDAEVMLVLEAGLHRAAGWRVRVMSEGLAARIVAERGGIRRVVTVEERREENQK